MKQKLRLLLLLILCALTLSACDDDDADYEDYDYTEEASEDEDNSGKASTSIGSNNTGKKNDSGNTWSIFLYLCGTDLESDSEGGAAASLNIAESLYADMSDNVNFVIQTGGTKQWKGDYFDLPMDVDPNKIQRWQITNDEIALVDEQKLTSMGSSDTLSDFLKWGTSNYPADKNMVIFWDHGGGAGSGVAFDELFDDDFLTLEEISTGLADSGASYELVGFDACLMSTLETAAALAPYANFMVASEETEPGAGWDYSNWISYLSQDTTMTGDILGIQICDSFMQKCSDYGLDSMSTLAVTDLSKIPALCAAFDEMASQMKGISGDVRSMKVMKQAISRSEKYGEDPNVNSNMVDLGDLTLNAKDVLPDTAEKVIDCIIDADVYHVGGDGRQKGNGLAIYVPVSTNKEQLSVYAKASAISADYLRFIEGMTGWKAPKDVVIHSPVIEGTDEVVVDDTKLEEVEEAQTIDASDYNVRFNMDIDDDGYLTLNIKEGADIISEAKCNLYYIYEDTGLFVYMGSDYNVDINDDWTEMKDNFQNTWVFIEDQLCEMMAVDINDDYIVYVVPIKVNGKRTNLRMIYSYDTEEYTIAGLWDGMDADSDFANRSSENLKKGDKVELLFDVYDSETDEEEEVELGSFTVKGNLRVEEAELEDGSYAYGFELIDIFDESYFSDFAFIDVEDGEIYTSLE